MKSISSCLRKSLILAGLFWLSNKFRIHAWLWLGSKDLGYLRLCLELKCSSIMAKNTAVHGLEFIVTFYYLLSSLEPRGTVQGAKQFILKGLHMILPNTKHSLPNMKQYIILKDGILRFNSFNITSKRGVYFTVHSLDCGSTLYHCFFDRVVSFKNSL